MNGFHYYTIGSQGKNDEAVLRVAKDGSVAAA